MRLRPTFTPTPAAPAGARGWLGVAARPGSGLGLLPAALSMQPLATLVALILAGGAGLLVPRLGRRGGG